MSPLFLAAIHKAESVVDVLLDGDADCRMQASNGNRPIDMQVRIAEFSSAVRR